MGGGGTCGSTVARCAGISGDELSILFDGIRGLVGTSGSTDLGIVMGVAGTGAALESTRSLEIVGGMTLAAAGGGEITLGCVGGNATAGGETTLACPMGTIPLVRFECAVPSADPTLDPG